MEGKTVLITGATSGIGFHTAKALASKGARVLITGSNERRGREATDELRRRAGHDRVHFLAADRSAVGVNFDLAERVSNRLDRLDVVVNNVGGLYARRQETTDGCEATLAMNYLGVVANATNPGMAWTTQTRSLTPEAVPAWRFFWPLVRLVQRRTSAEAASKSSVFLASSEEAANVSGAYFESNAKPGRPSKLALDVENQELAWNLAQTLIARA